MKSFLKSQEGATAIEYGLICAVVILVMIVGLSVLGNGTGIEFNYISQKVDESM